MISTAWRPRTRRLLIIAVVLSVLVHLAGGWLWSLVRHTPIVMSMMSGDPEAKRKEREAATPELIEIEKAPPKAQPKVAPPPRSHFAELKPLAHAEIPRPAARPQPELVHLVAHAARTQPTEKGGGRPENVPQPRAAAAERPSPHHDSSHLTSDQIAKLESQFSQTIQSTHQDLASTVAQVKEPVAGQRRLIADGLEPGQGYMRPIEGPELVARYVRRYYVHYTYMYPDGHIEEDDIPWPFFFSAHDDPFTRGRNSVMYMQLPPRGFRPTRQLFPKEEEAYDEMLSGSQQPPATP
jgi:hypothetical protein